MINTRYDQQKDLEYQLRQIQFNHAFKKVKAYYETLEILEKTGASFQKDRYIDMMYKQVTKNLRTFLKEYSKKEKQILEEQLNSVLNR